jgi:TusA-related sulfurtransferase
LKEVIERKKANKKINANPILKVEIKKKKSKKKIKRNKKNKN